jgi:hypothetical protein
MSPSPKPFIGSLLLTEEIWQARTGSHLSVDKTLTVTGTILWFGGQRIFGLALTLSMTGGVVSTTATAELHAVAPAKPSSTSSSTQSYRSPKILR